MIFWGHARYDLCALFSGLSQQSVHCVFVAHTPSLPSIQRYVTVVTFLMPNALAIGSLGLSAPRSTEFTVCGAMFFAIDHRSCEPAASQAWRRAATTSCSFISRLYTATLDTQEGMWDGVRVETLCLPRKAYPAKMLKKSGRPRCSCEDHRRCARVSDVKSKACVIGKMKRTWPEFRSPATARLA